MINEVLKARHVNILYKITDGLACLHKIDLVHRDIKPHKILITPQEKFFISDFGPN